MEQNMVRNCEISNNNNKDDKETASNNNNLPSELSMAELELLKKLEEANRLIESDTRSLNSLTDPCTGQTQGSPSGHSRMSSITSQISTKSSDEQIVAESGEEDLWTTWGKLLNEWDSNYKKNTNIVKELVRKGIPHHFRGLAWQMLCGAHNLQEKIKYSEYMKTKSACEKVIRRDIARTYPEHDFFKKKDGVGQESLFNVMKAYSIHDREVGYCQGSAFIVGLLLMQMPEEESFAVILKIMQEYRMREMFKPSMAELGLCMYQLDTLVQEHIPDLYVHFQSQAIHTNLYASSWFLTLFTTSLPLNISCRIMDCFLSEGIEIIFRIALTLLTIAKHELLLLDMEGVIKYFQSEMPKKFEADQDAVFSMAFLIKINQKKMKRLEKEYTTMKSKEKEDEIELRRMRTENRLLRQRIDMLETESSELADRLIQGQVTRAEEEETAFAMKRELSAIKQHDIDTNQKLVEARDRIKNLEDLSSKPTSLEEVSLKTEIIEQKQEMINCLQDELIKVRLRDAENEETIKSLRGKISESEEERKREREDIPEDNVASLQEELAASKLREAESNLALKDLRSKVSELNTMWQKHLKRSENPSAQSEVPSTPKKLLGSLLEGKSDAARLEEELMTSRLREVEGMAELKELRLKVMELETKTHVIHNQLKRRSEEVQKLTDLLEESSRKETDLQTLLRESKRKFTDLEGKLKEDLMMARIRDTENSQCVAELTQKISNLEFKNQEQTTEDDLTTSLNASDRMRELQDKVASLRAQVTRLALMNSKLTQSLSMHNLANSFDSDSDTSGDKFWLIMSCPLSTTSISQVQPLISHVQSPPHNHPWP
eukprot:TRINITY_DN174_c0_g1_i2.p1 TRINITY_DN174_c0_g1~~TRINITY_DN174_c0_g1_i2.p1  ORF type:complete len:832 (-),score=235.75 TRINITY_DN174_c0_g1_i2:254-2749(-)